MSKDGKKLTINFDDYGTDELWEAVREIEREISRRSHELDRQAESALEVSRGTK